MGPVGLVWLVVSVGLGAFLGAFFLCRICFLRGFLRSFCRWGLLVIFARYAKKDAISNCI